MRKTSSTVLTLSLALSACGHKDHHKNEPTRFTADQLSGTWLNGVNVVETEKDNSPGKLLFMFSDGKVEELNRDSEDKRCGMERPFTIENNNRLTMPGIKNCLPRTFEIQQADAKELILMDEGRHAYYFIRPTSAELQGFVSNVIDDKAKLDQRLTPYFIEPASKEGLIEHVNANRSKFVDMQVRVNQEKFSHLVPEGNDYVFQGTGSQSDDTCKININGFMLEALKQAKAEYVKPVSKVQMRLPLLESNVWTMLVYADEKYLNDIGMLELDEAERTRLLEKQKSGIFSTQKTRLNTLSFWNSDLKVVCSRPLSSNPWTLEQALAIVGSAIEVTQP